MYGLDNAAREALQKHLRNADELFRQKNYTSALAELDKALAIDPRSSLARTFRERINLALKQLQPGAQSVGASPHEDQAAQIPSLFRDIEGHLSRKDFHTAKTVAQQILAIDSENFYAKAYLDTIDQQQRQHIAEVANTLQSAPAMSVLPPSDLPKGSLTMYREMLKEFWFDGKISSEESRQLQEIRSLFGITTAEHTMIEREVKLQAYIDALQIAWKDGVVTENEQKVLQLMRQRFSISAEEHLSAEMKIEEARRSRSSKGTILLVDGDMETLTGLIAELKRRNYEVLIAHYIEDALNVLITRTPDVIISELFFEQRGVDGFSLYSKIGELPQFRDVPFFFMSSYSDEKVVRAGVRIGVDHFFRKPLDMKQVITGIDAALRPRRNI